MTTQHVVHLRSSGAQSNYVYPWEEALMQREYALLRAYTIKQALFMAKSNALIAVLIDLDESTSRSAEKIREIKQVTSPQRSGLIGLATSSLNSSDLKDLAWAGLDVVIPALSPPDFLVYQLKLHQVTLDLRKLDQIGNEAKLISAETRKRMHDISQPLTALQGRLQILEADSRPTDPDHHIIQELVRLVFKVTDRLNELHEYHRKFR